MVCGEMWDAKSVSVGGVLARKIPSSQRQPADSGDLSAGFIECERSFPEHFAKILFSGGFLADELPVF